MRRLTALCEDPARAQKVIEALIELGVSTEDVSVLVSRHGAVEEAPLRHITRVPQRAAAGGAIGAAFGAGLVAIGFLPGVFAMGPAIAALQGIVGGVAAGSLAGALSGLGWWKTEADVPKDLLANDAVLVGVPISEERASAAIAAAESAGAARVYLA
ncbi:MAG TPA: hypothetical protein VFT98_18310 [Myxococcota bacterium]|nr:hypothetical protein [Myxococcota bacterium]